MRVLRAAFVIALCLAASACATTPSAATSAPLPWANARQLVVVTAPTWDSPTGTLRRYGRDGGGWKEAAAPIAVTIGKAGMGWGLGLHPEQTVEPQKREGDGRAAAGVFAIGKGFGYSDGVATGLRYQAMQTHDWCVDVSASPLYNQLVDTRVVGEAAIAGSTEPMRRDLHLQGDPLYVLGFVIEQNPRHVAGRGSCIFAHVWRAPGAATAGCTAMEKDEMARLLAWLDADARPIFVLLPEDEYAKRRAAWQLPALTEATP